MGPVNMPNSLIKTAPAMFFAILCGGCMSQNAMSLVPDSVRLEIAQQKAAKAAPVSVGQMLQKARVSAAAERTQQSPAAAAAGKADDKPVDEISAPNAALPPVSDGPRPRPAQKAALKTAANEERGEMLPESRNAVELFADARALHRRVQPADLDFTDDLSDAESDGKKSGGGSDTWRAMLAQAQEGPEDTMRAASSDENNAADKDRSITTSSLPDSPASGSESIPVKFIGGLTGLAKDDELKIRLLRHGKRYPGTIVIGKVEGVKGFQAMEKALALGRIIAEASGGMPDISYDPALSARTAVLHYVKPDAAQ
jgi:hypothetical protein